VARPAEIVERYFAAWTSGDFETARTLLADDLAFVGPFRCASTSSWAEQARNALAVR
jgi:ketosteroid isomerase-like protein